MPETEYTPDTMENHDKIEEEEATPLTDDELIKNIKLLVEAYTDINLIDTDENKKISPEDDKYVLCNETNTKWLKRDLRKELGKQATEAILRGLITIPTTTPEPSKTQEE